MSTSSPNDVELITSAVKSTENPIHDNSSSRKMSVRLTMSVAAAANRAISAFTDDEDSQMRLTTVKAVKGKGKIFIWRYIFVSVSVIAFFTLSILYFLANPVQSLVSGQQNPNSICSDPQELYSIATVNETSKLSIYRDDCGLANALVMTLTAEFIQSPPNNDPAYLADTNNPTLFPASSEGSSSFEYDGDTCSNNVDSNITLYTSWGSLTAPQESTNFTLITAPIKLRCSVSIQPSPQAKKSLYMYAPCNENFHFFQLVADMSVVTTGGISASCAISVCGTPLLYYTRVTSPTPIGIYQCDNKPNALSIFSQSYAFAKAVFDFLMIMTMMLLAYKYLGWEQFWTYLLEGKV